jgi:hypothetical protein
MRRLTECDTNVRLREIARRMPSFRGEFAAIHPKYAEDSPARCVPFTATTEAFEDFVYSKDDDEKIDDWLRENIGYVFLVHSFPSETDQSCFMIVPRGIHAPPTQ